MRPVGHDEKHPIGNGAAGQVVQEPQAGLVGLMGIVDDQHRPCPGRRRAGAARRRPRTAAGARSAPAHSTGRPDSPLSISNRSLSSSPSSSAG